jgi:hypothetical protein
VPIEDKSRRCEIETAATKRGTSAQVSPAIRDALANLRIHDLVLKMNESVKYSYSSGIHIFQRRIICYFAYLFAHYVHLLQVQTYCWKTSQTTGVTLNQYVKYSLYP